MILQVNVQVEVFERIALLFQDDNNDDRVSDASTTPAH